MGAADRRPQREHRVDGLCLRRLCAPAREPPAVDGDLDRRGGGPEPVDPERAGGGGGEVGPEPPQPRQGPGAARRRGHGPRFGSRSHEAVSSGRDSGTDGTGLRPGDGLRVAGFRGLERCGVRRRGGPRPAAEPAARLARGHRCHHCDLPGGQRRVPGGAWGFEAARWSNTLLAADLLGRAFGDWGSASRSVCW